MPAHEATGKRAKAKRNLIVAKVACDACRKSKTKCNKDRPSCSTWQEGDLECHYSEDPDDSPFKVLKRKYSSLQETFAEQEREISRLRSRYEPQSQSEESSSSGSPLPCERSVQGSEAVLSSQAVSLRTRPVLYSPPQAQPADLGSSALRLIKALSSKSDFDSTTLLARLRLGEDWRKIADELPAGLVTSETNVQQVAYLMQPKTQVVSKSWLPAIFDRQYFMQICYIPCIPNTSSLPTTPGSDLSFGNLSFSSAVTANHQPEHIQQAQVENLFGPQWSKPILNGSTVNTDPFDVVLTELRADLACGVDFDELCGSHAYIGALDDEATFHRAPKLSQVVARIIGSIKSTDASTTFTQRAMMHWFWALWRWQLRPTSDTYREVPEFAKPMPSQLFVSHPSVFDFVVFPKLRERVCQADTPNVQWMTEAAITVHCDWDEKISSTLSKDGSTLELDLNPICKAYISAEKNWTLGPSVREFLSDADSLVSIKGEDPA